MNIKNFIITYCKNKTKHWLVYKIVREIKAYTLFLIRKIRWTVQDHYYDKKLGIETSEVLVFKERISLYKDDEAYYPINYYILEKVIDYLKLSDDDIFIDFGCGKGRVIFFAALEKIKKVVGIELRKELVDIAKRNLHSLKLNNTPIEIINADAANFNIKNETVFFMFNPFGRKTLARVVDNIRESLIVNPRIIRIVYFNAVHYDLLDSQDWLVPEGEIDNTKVLVWRNILIE